VNGKIKSFLHSLSASKHTQVIASPES